VGGGVLQVIGNGRTYRYRIVPVEVMHMIAALDEEVDHDAIAFHPVTEEVLRLLDLGFRWVRTENEMAVLEYEGPEELRDGKTVDQVGASPLFG
jgi:hypothetical protein